METNCKCGHHCSRESGTNDDDGTKREFPALLLMRNAHGRERERERVEECVWSCSSPLKRASPMIVQTASHVPHTAFAARNMGADQPGEGAAPTKMDSARWISKAGSASVTRSTSHDVEWRRGVIRSPPGRGDGSAKTSLPLLSLSPSFSVSAAHIC